MQAKQVYGSACLCMLAYPGTGKASIWVSMLVYACVPRHRQSKYMGQHACVCLRTPVQSSPPPSPEADSTSLENLVGTHTSSI